MVAEIVSTGSYLPGEPISNARMEALVGPLPADILEGIQGTQRHWIVDLETGTSIDFGQLDRVAIDMAAYLKSKGIQKGSRVLVLSDECLEKLLIWFGVWRIGAVICPFNLEINEKQMADLTAALTTLRSADVKWYVWAKNWSVSGSLCPVRPRISSATASLLPLSPTGTTPTGTSPSADAIVRIVRRPARAAARARTSASRSAERASRSR